MNSRRHRSLFVWCQWKLNMPLWRCTTPGFVATTQCWRIHLEKIYDSSPSVKVIFLFSECTTDPCGESAVEFIHKYSVAKTTTDGPFIMPQLCGDVYMSFPHSPIGQSGWMWQNWNGTVINSQAHVWTKSINAIQLTWMPIVRPTLAHSGPGHGTHRAFLRQFTHWTFMDLVSDNIKGFAYASIELSK